MRWWQCQTVDRCEKNIRDFTGSNPARVCLCFIHCTAVISNLADIVIVGLWMK
jgi:hypothetical protein